MSDPAVVRLADNTLLLVQELRNSTLQFGRNVEALHTSVEAMNALRREISDGNAEYEKVVRGVEHELKQVNKSLAIISNDVDDVERVTREATGIHALVAAKDSKEGLLRAFGELPWYTQMLVVVGVAVAGGFGHWLLSLIGK